MSDSSAFPCSLSVVVPCYNEGEGLRRLHQRLTDTLGSLPGAELEVVYVDDGSRDATPDVLRSLQAQDSRVRVLSLSRNFGKEAAVAAGIDHATGDAVAVMDADLQEPPEAVLDMLERCRAGADVAYGVRTSRKHDPWSVRWSSSVYSRTHDLLAAGPPLHGRCDFVLMTRDVVNALKAMPERVRVHRSLIACVGFRQDPVRFERPDRGWGRPKIRFWRRLHTARTSLVATSVAPLRLALFAGLVAGGTSVLLAGCVVGARVLGGAWPPSWTILTSLGLLVVGLQFAFLGLIGEYVGAVLQEVQGRPLYLVKERAGFDDGAVVERPPGAATARPP